jgi:hypothetical protein
LTLPRRVPICIDGRTEERAVVDNKRGGSAKVGEQPVKTGRLERELEEGLEETFPGSDAPAATQPVHHARHPRKN